MAGKKKRTSFNISEKELEVFIQAKVSSTNNYKSILKCMWPQLEGNKLDMNASLYQAYKDVMMGLKKHLQRFELGLQHSRLWNINSGRSGKSSMLSQLSWDFSVFIIRPCITGKPCNPSFKVYI